MTFNTGTLKLKSSAVSYLALLPILFILAGYVVFPLFRIFQESLTADGKFSFLNYGKFFSPKNSVNLESMFNSIGISVISIFTAGTVGTLLAFILESYEFPGRRVLRIFAIVPMALPPLIGSISFDFLYGESGIFPRALKQIFGLPQVPFYLDGIAGVILVHTFTMYTYFYLPLSAALKKFDYSIEEVASNLGAGKTRTFFQVKLPMLTPSFLASTMLVFMISMASYTAPLIYGVDRTLTMQIYLSRTNGNMALASTQSAVLATVSVLFMMIMRWYEGRRNYMSVAKGVSPVRREVKSRLAKMFTVTGSAALVILLMLPIFVIFLISFSKDGSWTVQVLPPVYTIGNYIKLFADPRVLLPIKNSVLMSLIAMTGNLFFGIIAAYVMSRKRIYGKSLIDSIINIPWALPGTVIAISMIVAFNVPNVFSFNQILVGTFAILPLTYFVRCLPLVYKQTYATFKQIDVSSEEAARGLGASWFYCFRRVVIPMVASGAMAGAILAFVQGFGEFVASILLYTPRTIPISVAVNQKLYDFQFGTACAYGSIQIVIVFFLLLVSEFFKKNSK
jgi:iron(III) transport system permease protein